MSNDALPPDAQAANKARINNDIIKFCSTPVPLYCTPSARGIGLYTHVAGPGTVSQNPHYKFASAPGGEIALLPLGGLHKAVPGEPQVSSDGEVTALYKELQDSVKAEEKIWEDMRNAAEARGESAKDAYTITLELLQTKYGSVQTEEGDVRPRLDHSRQDKRRRSEPTNEASDGEAPKKRKTISLAELSIRRSSADATTDGTNLDAERRDSASRPRNFYEADRDPRLRKQQEDTN
ncbi:hypothetical protein N0V94_007010 [Neodidymelliopsis sp. IMI 364377]|nr:hypothetical protein N0V94_007010 [Neodidymelliopsis sp. IMI 364377]